ncbi:MAG: hypothetical protein R3F61_17545 [Myxococcota bacterium]
MKVACPSCFRAERWEGGEKHVDIEGGQRRPSVAPELAAWNTCRQAREAGRVVIGPCVCGQPMVAPSGEWHDWEIPTPAGRFVVRADGQDGPSGPIDTEAAQARLDALFREPFEVRPFLWLFQSTLMLSVIAPALLWTLAVGMVLLFLSSFMNPPGFGP